MIFGQRRHTPLALALPHPAAHTSSDSRRPQSTRKLVLESAGERLGTTSRRARRTHFRGMVELPLVASTGCNDRYRAPLESQFATRSCRSFVTKPDVRELRISATSHRNADAASRSPGGDAVPILRLASQHRQGKESNTVTTGVMNRRTPSGIPSEGVIACVIDEVDFVQAPHGRPAMAMAGQKARFDRRGWS